jgi:hypothetical protein
LAGPTAEITYCTYGILVTPLTVSADTWTDLCSLTTTSEDHESLFFSGYIQAADSMDCSGLVRIRYGTEFHPVEDGIYIYCPNLGLKRATFFGLFIPKQIKSGTVWLQFKTSNAGDYLAYFQAFGQSPHHHR